MPALLQTPSQLADIIQKSLQRVQSAYEQRLAQSFKAMDHTMETIAEKLEKYKTHKLYEEAEGMEAFRDHFKPFILRSNITDLALLKSEIEHTNSIKTFIVLHAVATSEVLSHVLYRATRYKCRFTQKVTTAVGCHTGSR